MAPPLPSPRVADTIARLRARLQRGELVVPPYPAIAARVQQLSTDERADSRTLAELVGRDPALAALVIRHASAAATGLGAILTLEQGLDGLRDIAGLDHDERFRIGALIPQVGALMASFEAYLPLAAAPAAIAPVARVEGWPLDLPVTLRTKHGAARAVWLTPTALVIHAPTALAINLLTSLQLGDGAAGFELLANVVGCAAAPTGGFLITAQPFALDGPIKVAWLELINQARRSAVAAAS